MYEQPTPGRRIGPALIAVLVVLAAAAGTLGYFGARAIIDGQGGGPLAGASSTGVPHTQPPPTATTSSPVTSPTTPKTSTRTTTAPPVPPGDPTTCPQPTVDALNAAGLNSDLTVQLYIQTHKAGIYDAEVWICKNADGLLVYQGHVLSAPLDLADNGQNTILLATGIKGSVVVDPTGYLASNPNGTSTTEYHVSRTKLITVQRPSRVQTTYNVIKVYP